MKEDLRREAELPSKVTVKIEESILVVKGPKGEVRRSFKHPRIKISFEGSQIILLASRATKREKTILGSMEAHLQNMIKGVQEPFVYILKICSGHFPMSVSVSGHELIVKNFLGETVPRKTSFGAGVEVKISGTEISVTSADKELAGQTAGKIENLCRITNRDRRVFQDGCYITHKGGVAI